MLLLTSTTDALQVVTTSAAATSVHASWVDTNTSTGAITPGRTNTAISSAATTTVVAAPATGVQRNVKTLHIRNSDVSLSNTITVQHTDGTVVAQLAKRTLAPGDSLQYTDQGGFAAAAGGAGFTPPPLTYIFTSGSGTFVTPNGAAWLDVEIMGGGGGGQGGGVGAANGGAGGQTNFGIATAGGGCPGGAPAGAVCSNCTYSDVGAPGDGGGVAPAGASGLAAKGGMGAASSRGAGGAGNYGNNGSGALVYGAGGAGGGVNGAVIQQAGAGGGAGAFGVVRFMPPAASYSWVVGIAGGAGTYGSNGFNGGGGASGYIIVTVHFGP